MKHNICVRECVCESTPHAGMADGATQLFTGGFMSFAICAAAG